MAAYRTALAELTPPPSPPRQTKPAPNTLRWLVFEYFSSAYFKDALPSARSRHVRRKVLEKVCETAGEEPLTNITAQAIRKGMDRRADTPEAANSFLKAMRGLFAFAVQYQHTKINLTLGIKKLRSRNPEGWHTWTVEEVRQMRPDTRGRHEGTPRACASALHRHPPL